MKKKIFTIFSFVILLAVSAMLFITPNVYADGMPDAGQLQGQATDFINKGQAAAKIDANKIAEIMKPLASLLLGIGTVVLVIITAIMGIKYMTASPDVRAKLKTQLIGIAISAVVLFGAYGIWSIAYNIMNELTK